MERSDLEPRAVIRVYRGPSMRPTLKPGDALFVRPCRRPPRAGDVIVFVPPGRDRTCAVVHRVVSTGGDGIRTRGDGSLEADPWTLEPDRIEGAVFDVRRGGRALRISGGLRGRLRGLGCRALSRIDAMVSRLLRRPYRRLARSSVFPRWRFGAAEPRVVSFQRREGTELQLIFFRHVIGRRLPSIGEWWIRRPFRLFVDVQTLDEIEPYDRRT